VLYREILIKVQRCTQTV